MSYLLDKKVKKKKFSYIVLSFFVCLILFYFRLGIWGGLSYLTNRFFHPVFTLGNFVGEKLGGIRSLFISKSSLDMQNKTLQSQLDEDKAAMANYNSILAENNSLKEILGRKNEKTPMVLSAILSKPDQSPYDTIIIDAGEKEGLKVGDMVFASGNVPVGRLALVYPDSSKVILFSNSGEKTQVVVGGKNIFLEAIGRGGGNFEMVLPRNFTPAKGDQVLLPGITSYVLAVIETIISDPRDPFVKALLVSPVNVEELRFVEVKI